MWVRDVHEILFPHEQPLPIFCLKGVRRDRDGGGSGVRTDFGPRYPRHLDVDGWVHTRLPTTFATLVTLMKNPLIQEFASSSVLSEFHVINRGVLQ